MADSGDDEDGRKPTVNFLFGNVDAKGKLEDASYMDEQLIAEYERDSQTPSGAIKYQANTQDARESLEALGQERLGAGLNQLKGLDAQSEQDQGEVEKDAVAVDYYDEAEMVDYTPPVAQGPGVGLLAAAAAHPAAPNIDEDDDYDEEGDASQPAPFAPRLPLLGPASRALRTSTAPMGPHHGNIVAAPQPGMADPGEKVELPVLANDGESAVLRFSQLFAPTAETTKPARLPVNRWVAAPATCQVEDAGSEEDEADAFHHQLAVEAVQLSSSEEEDVEATEEAEATKHAPASGEGVPAMPPMQHGRQRKQHPGEPLSAGVEARLIGFVVLPDSSFEAVQQLDWEASIVWDQDVHAPSQDAAEEHEDEDTDSAAATHDGHGSQQAEDTEAAVAAEERRHSGVQASTSQMLHQANAWLAEGGWEEDVRWEADTGLPNTSTVLLDLNDPHMTFQMAKLAHSPSLLDHAAAQVLPAAIKVRPVQAPPAGKGLVYALLARLNVSQDEEYAKRKAKKGAQPAFRFKHATPAASLQTLPVRHADLREYEHRPRGLWLPLPSKARAKAKEGEKSTVKIWSLVGHGKDAVNRIFKAVDLQATTLNMLWDVLKAGGKFADLARLETSKWGIWYRGPQPHAVARDVPLAQADVPLDANMDLSLVVTGVQPLPSATANTILGPSANTAPSVAFQKTKQLTGADGHIVLLEYMEEHPLLLSRPGMAVRLSTYYRRQSPTDSEHQRLLAAAGERWRVGAVEALQPQEGSPFYLGDMAPGAHQLSVDANMFRSPAFPHARATSDFLVLRAASGALSLRELTGCLAVGQQEPLRRVPAPNSKECRDMEEARMVAYVLRELRRQQSKRDKGRSKEEPCISVRELANLFPDLSEGVIRARLKDRCGCVPLRDDAAGTHRLAEGVAIADERELRQLARPEDWCAHESMTAGLSRLLRSGVANQDRLAGLPQERLHIAAEQLSPPEKYAMALAELDLAVQTAPWALTDNFVSAVREGRGALALTGPGDPTARGQGFSYMRENIKAPSAKAVTAMPAAKEGNITGTDKDLRRLTMKESKVILMKMGLTEDEVKGLSRWQRIAAVRDLSSAAAGEEGGELGKLGLRYARSNRTSADEAHRARKVQAQQIFERQAAVLGGPLEEAEDGGSDAESWGDELEKELEGDEASAAQQAQDVDEDAELEDLEELRRDGFLKEKPDGSFPSAKPKLLAKPGERRIKRTIRYVDANTEGQTRVIIYTDRDKIHALNELYKKDGREALVGFGKRRIVGGGALPIADEDSPLAKKRKLSRVKCKACGQMGHYKSNRNCPLYAQTYASAAQGKPSKKATKPKRELGEDGGSDDAVEKDVGAPKPPGLRITISSSALGSPGGSKRRLSTDLSPPTLGTSLKRAPSKSGAGSARRQLAYAVLYKVVSTVKKQLSESMWAPFKMAVAKSSAPDYADFIPAADEMHLEKIERKIKNAKYNSSEEMLADFGRIVRNASMYNAPGNGKFGGPAIVGWAESLQNAVISQLQSEAHARTAAEIEAAIVAEDAEREAHKETRQAASKAPPEAPDEPEGPEETDHWVQCSKCHKWRNVSQKVADETVTSNPDAPWFCNWDTERPNASCDQLDDYEMSVKLGIS